MIIRERCKAWTNKFDHRKFLSFGSACVGEEGLFDNQKFLQQEPGSECLLSLLLVRNRTIG